MEGSKRRKKTKKEPECCESTILIDLGWLLEEMEVYSDFLTESEWATVSYVNDAILGGVFKETDYLVVSDIYTNLQLRKGFKLA